MTTFDLRDKRTIHGMITLRQFEAEKRAYCMREYGTTAREYDAAYPRDSRRYQWFEELERAAYQGVQPSRHVQRSIIAAYPPSVGQRVIDELTRTATHAEWQRSAPR